MLIVLFSIIKVGSPHSNQRIVLNQKTQVNVPFQGGAFVTQQGSNETQFRYKNLIFRNIKSNYFF